MILKKNSRRNFIKKSITGIAGAAVLPSVVGAEYLGGEKEKSPEYAERTLGKTGMKVPVVSMGVMNAENPKLVEAALDRGIKYLDTAYYYQRGRNEEMIGRVIKNRKRDSFFIATKVPGNFADRKTGLFTERTDPEDFVRKFEISLKRLGLDYVDVLFLHNIKRGESAVFEPLMSVMSKIKKSGKARFIGVSTHSHEPEVIRAAADSGVYDIVLTAYNFFQPHKLEIEKAINYAANKGLGTVVMKTQAGVFWERPRRRPVNMKAALKWALKNPNVHTSIPGFTTFDQLETDLSVMKDLKMTDSEKKDLRLEEGGEKLSGMFCNQCEQCIPQCRYEVDIPTIMRSYMYAFGYRNLLQAKDILSDIDLVNLPCNDCDTCEVKCAVGFDIKGKIKEIAKINNISDTFLT